MANGADYGQGYGAGVIPGTTTQADPWASGVAGSSGVSLGTGTGQHGSAPVGDNGTMNNGNPFTTLFDWINKPFTTPLSAWDIFLLVGAVLIAGLLWNFILYHVRIAAETI